MLALDTDHLSVLGDVTPHSEILAARLDDAHEEVVTTVISVEENVRGWLAQIRRANSAERRIRAYTRFQQRVEFFANWIILPWNADAERIWERLRREGVRIGTMDLRVSSVALAHDATLLTRNTTDFARIPGLRIVNWLD